jgi:hypothetical protein
MRLNMECLSEVLEYLKLVTCPEGFPAVKRGCEDCPSFEECVSQRIYAAACRDAEFVIREAVVEAKKLPYDAESEILKAVEAMESNKGKVIKGQVIKLIAEAFRKLRGG